MALTEDIDGDGKEGWARCVSHLAFLQYFAISLPPNTLFYLTMLNLPLLNASCLEFAYPIHQTSFAIRYSNLSHCFTFFLCPVLSFLFATSNAIDLFCYSHSFRRHMGTFSFSPSTFLGSTITMKNPSPCKSLLVQYVQSSPLRPDKRTARSQHAAPRPQRADILADYASLESRVGPAFRPGVPQEPTMSPIFSPNSQAIFVRSRCSSISIPRTTVYR